MKWTFATLSAVVLALACAACGGADTTTPTTPTVTTGPSTELFEAKLSPGGFAFYSFTVTSTGSTNVMLASVTTSTSPGASSAVALGLAIGTPLGEDCVITTAVIASAGLTSQLVSSLTPGTYCTRVYDIGNLRSTVNFAVRILHT
jgi:hypothetical protein